MKMKTLVGSFHPLILCLLLLTVSQKLAAQGCSDAGVCTSGGIKSGYSSAETQGVELGIGTLIGLGEQGSLITQIPLDFRWFASEKWSFQVKSSFQGVFGNLGETYGFTDPIISATYQIKNVQLQTSSVRWMGVLGARIPLNQASKSIQYAGKSLDLPMPYQTSLGTFDVIAGVTYQKEKMQISAAVQVPIFQENNNTFNAINWNTVGNSLPWEGYFQSAYLKRSPDIFIRYDQFISKKPSYRLGIGGMIIYHITKDQMVDSIGSNGNKNYIDIDQSQGPTLNINVTYTRFIAEHKRRWELGLAFPVLVRQNRPDGLTRAFVLSYSYYFGIMKDH